MTISDDVAKAQKRLLKNTGRYPNRIVIHPDLIRAWDWQCACAAWLGQEVQRAFDGREVPWKAPPSWFVEFSGNPFRFQSLRLPASPHEVPK